jgi:DNA-binding Lrp family transcriptional regulator
LTNLDWRIIEKLRGNALRPLEEVASEVGVSAKTVRRRFDRIMAEGSAFIQPRVDWGKATGFIPFVLNFHLKPGSTKAALAPILKAFDERYLFACIPASAQLGNYALQLFAFSVAEVEDLKRKALGLAGVERVEALIMRGMRGNPDWMADAIAQKVQETAKPMVAAV